LKESYFLSFPKLKPISARVFLILLIVGVLIIEFFLMKSMRQMVMLAAMISFLTAPYLAFVNYRLITDSNFPAEYKWSRKMILFARIGLVFLVGFALMYLYTLIKY
jgi:Mn2+/Fe2+ NRAMP family transporter